jgi:hypothetical protein
VLPKPILFLRKQKYESQAQQNSNSQKDEKKAAYKDMMAANFDPSETDFLNNPPASGNN